MDWVWNESGCLPGCGANDFRERGDLMVQVAFGVVCEHVFVVNCDGSVSKDLGKLGG